MIREGNAEDKTKLDDGAAIYQKREVRSYKDTMADLHGFEKIEFFCQYYLGKILFIAAIAGLLIYLLYSIFRTKPENILYMAVINTPVEETMYDGLKADLTELLVADDVHEQVYIDSSYYLYDGRSDYEMRMTFVTHIASREIDILIIPKSELINQVNNTVLHTVDKALSPEIVSKLKNAGVAMFSMTPEKGPQDEEDYVPVEGIYGIEITDYLQSIGADMMREHYYLAFVINSEHTDKYENVTKYFFSDILGEPTPVEKIGDK